MSKNISLCHAPQITDEVINKAFEGTNFGRTDYREFLGYSVLQKACHWYCGHTITSIMIGLELITPKTHRLTKLGRMFLSDCYDDPMRIKASPAVVPDGWKLVPVEPTEDMVIQGFESEPKLLFSDPEDWDKYESMSGCQQAAHKARLCWAAMLEAAPTLLQ